MKTFIDVRNNFIDMFNGIKNNSNMKIISIRDEFELLSKEDKEMVIENIQKRYNVTFNNMMKEILIPNLTFCWHYIIAENVYTGGEFNLSGTPYLFVDTSKTAFSNSLTDYSKKLYKEGYRFFDSHPHAGDGIFAAIKIEKNSIAETVYMADIIHEEISEMMINYPEYIAHTIKLKGLYDWQYLFMKDNFKYKSFDTAILQKRLKDHSQLFPEIDVNEYLELCE